MTLSQKAVFDHTDDELRQFYRVNAPVFAISQNDILAELDRRASRRQARASFFLSWVGLVIALAALVVKTGP